jgi:NAD(P)-dependent dehydrogenase (short-subunit alcohol dehydrogenase family)
MDLASLASVQTGAKSILSQTSILDILIADAGIMALPPVSPKMGTSYNSAPTTSGTLFS